MVITPLWQKFSLAQKGSLEASAPLSIFLVLKPLLGNCGLCGCKQNWFTATIF
jgi:hypothetical protein